MFDSGEHLWDVVNAQGESFFSVSQAFDLAAFMFQGDSTSFIVNIVACNRTLFNNNSTSVLCSLSAPHRFTTQIYSDAVCVP